jgi:RimJ/RimL family protein N-acetyltransferase
MTATNSIYALQTFSEPPRQDIVVLSACKIRTWQHKDIAQVRTHLNDPAMWSFLSADYPGEVSTEFAAHYLAAYSANSHAYFFAAAWLDSDEVIGGVFAELGQDIHRKSAEYGGWRARIGAPA